MSSLVGQGTVKAPPHHKIGLVVWACGQDHVVGAGLVGVRRQPLSQVVTSPSPSGLLRKQGLPLSNTGGRPVAAIPVDPPALRPSLPAHSHLSVRKAVLLTSPAHSHIQDLTLSPFICSSDISLGFLFTSMWPGQARDGWTLSSLLLPDSVCSRGSGACATAELP